MTDAHAKQVHPEARRGTSSRLSRVSRRLWIVVGLAVAAIALFLLVPGSGSIALLVLLGGLMVLHHLPGGRGHSH